MDLTIPVAERSTVPDWVQLQAKVILEGNVPVESPLWYESLHEEIIVSETGRVSVKPGALNGLRRIKITPVADPSKSLELPIPVVRQGDLNFVIQ